MKRIEINTQKNENGFTNNSGYTFSENSNSTINNGVPFPVISGSTNLDYQVTSTCSENNSINYHVTKNDNEYSICIDWLEFICKKEVSIELAFINNQNPNIIIKKILVHKNPNFINLHKIYFHGVEILDIYSKPNNGKHLKNEISIKVNNALLYTNNYYSIITDFIKEFKINYVRLARLDIALDGADIMKIIDLLNKYSKSHTIQCSNDALTILPKAFNKKELKWLSWSIGKSKSGMSARVYNKSDEIVLQNKDYIASYWHENDVFHDIIGRFELQLNHKRLSKYNLGIHELKKLSDASFISSIFKNEVQSWFRLYKVRRKDYLNHKKEVVIKKGKEIKLFKWDKLPTNMDLLKTYDYISNSSAISASRNISFNLNEILLHPATSTTAQIQVIQKYARDYDLQDYVKNKITFLFGVEIKDCYKVFLDKLKL